MRISFATRLRRYLVLAGVAGLSSLPNLSALAEDGKAGGGADKANQLVYGETTRLDSYDPFTAPEAAGQRLADLIFDSLVTLGPGGESKPALAKSWGVGGGGTEITLVLRDGVTWHQRSSDLQAVPFTAADVVATVRLLNASKSDIPNRERFAVLKSAEALSPNRVKITLRRALTDPMRVLTFKILPAHIVGAAPGLRRDSDFAKAPVGTGPYQFVKTNAQGEVLLKANAKYFDGAPKIGQIVMKAFADQSIMAQGLMYNSLDLVPYLGPRDLGEVAADARLSVVPYDALSFSFFAMNTQRGVLKDKRVRQAISNAVNRQEMLDAFYQGKGRLISGPFPPTSWAYNMDVKPLAFDLARAKSLLAEAGLKPDSKGMLQLDGKPVTLNFAVPLAGENEMIKRVCLAFQSYLEATGIKVDLKFMDWGVWKKQVLGEHDYDLTIASWSFDDASNITSLFHSSSTGPWGNNFVQYSNHEVDALLTEADVTNDFDKKRAIYHKLHAILADEAPYTYLWTLQHQAAHTNRLSGVRVEPIQFFKYVISWRMEQGHGLN